MISALYRFPKAERSAIAREWARRSAKVRRAKCAATGADAETLAWREKQDRRGRIVRAIYGRGSLVEVRYSTHGRSDQFDVILNGSLWRTVGPRRLPAWLR